MRRLLPTMFAGMFAFALLVSSAAVPVEPVSAAPIATAPTVYCGDPGTDPSMDTGAGTMITCDTTVENNITAIDSVTGVATGSATITVTECVGPANGRLDPNDLTCTTDTQIVANLVTAVDQCNGVGYGGGNVLECSVEVVNTFVGVTPAAITAATVNQCNGSATDTTGCLPFPATTTNATITQSNNSSYGGGQEDFISIASGTTTATLNVTVNQCNDSNYGGGSWLTCEANVSNVVIPPVVVPTPTPTPTVAPTPAPTDSPVIPTPTNTPAPTAPPVTPIIPAPPAAPTEATPAATTVDGGTAISSPWMSDTAMASVLPETAIPALPVAALLLSSLVGIAVTNVRGRRAR